VLVVADGPRSVAETALCAQARDVISEIDWDCDVLKNYSDQNLGCGMRVHTGIDWAFSQFEELIVLEDDCIPTESFFAFCEELLARYRNDERVMHIGSFNFQPASPVTDHSYYFSKYTLASGAWATWRRAWKFYDANLASWPAAKSQRLIESWCSDPTSERTGPSFSTGCMKGRLTYGTTSGTTPVGFKMARDPAERAIGDQHRFGADATHTKSPIPTLMRRAG
jgi:hypothetical protein